jgi:hypothetical protein
MRGAEPGDVAALHSPVGRPLAGNIALAYGG